MSTGESTRPALKGRFPFRLGTSSFVKHADVETNVAWLADLVDDIELLLLEGDEPKLPGKATVAFLKETAEKKDLTYTIHWPMDARLGHPDESVRQESVRKVLHVVELVEPLKPLAHVVHFEPDGKDVSRWKESLNRSAEDLLRAGLDNRMLCVETLEAYSFEILDAIIRRHDLAVCFDVGHVVLRGESTTNVLERYSDRIRVVHLHGVLDGKDHKDIATVDPAFISQLLPYLGSDTALTLEVFSEEYFEKSMDVMEAYLP